MEELLEQHRSLAVTLITAHYLTQGVIGDLLMSSFLISSSDWFIRVDYGLDDDIYHWTAAFEHGGIVRATKKGEISVSETISNKPQAIIHERVMRDLDRIRSERLF